MARSVKLLPMTTPSFSDIRWKQGFHNFSKALQILVETKSLADARALSKLEQQGLIQGFEFAHELAWNVLKDYLEEQGFVDIIVDLAASIASDILQRFNPAFVAMSCTFEPLMNQPDQSL